jgi:acetylornithine deacetylase/succinyl-diaminopimelate desuccinylase-like protein
MDLDGHVRKLFMEFLPVWNPTGGEAELLQKVADWLRDRNIECVSDTSWGIWFQVTDTSDPMREAQDPLLLMAHLDSEERYLDRKGMAKINYNFFADEFCFRGPVGLDCKTGVVMCLAIVEQILSGLIPGASVRVLFTVAEEIGQRGLFRMPRDVLSDITREVKFAIALDRSTEAGGELTVSLVCTVNRPNACGVIFLAVIITWVLLRS